MFLQLLLRFLFVVAERLVGIAPGQLGWVSRLDLRFTIVHSCSRILPSRDRKGAVRLTKPLPYGHGSVRFVSVSAFLVSDGHGSVPLVSVWAFLTASHGYDSVVA